MKRNVSDEQLDQLMTTLLKDLAVDSEDLDHIADSSNLWQGVESRINSRQSPKFLAWPPPDVKKWFLIGVPALAGLLIVISLIAFRSDDLAVAEVEPVFTEVADINAPHLDTVQIDNEVDIPSSGVVSNGRPRKKLPKRPIKAKTVTQEKLQPGTKDNTAEIRSEFIALTYAGSPASGQIVRVQVPSSMMVRLGLVASVKAPSSLVSAEVIVGDDGQTHAIRFIR